MEKIYGYVRVSTKEQNEARQLNAMRSFGIAEKNIVVEKQSGKDFRRPIYLRLVKKLAPGDVLVVKSIDRLGRNYEEILEQWADLTRNRQIAIVVLDMPLLDTRCRHDLTGKLVANIVLELLSYVAESERRNIRERQAEGIAAAKARGVKFGPARQPLPETFYFFYSEWMNRRLSLREAAIGCGMPKSTFYDAVLREESSKKAKK